MSGKEGMTANLFANRIFYKINIPIAEVARELRREMRAASTANTAAKKKLSRTVTELLSDNDEEEDE